MDSSPSTVDPQLPQVAGVKRPAPGPLLPAFEFSSSPSLPRPAKRRALCLDKQQEDGVAKYPTPIPTSSTGIISSSPPHPGTVRPTLQRTQSTVSERAPLSTVPSINLSEDGEPLLMGRSSNSSHYQLSSNRLISRVHVKATYVRATIPLASNRIELVCMGWNGVKVHCQGRATDLGKGDTFTSETENADIMLDAQDARVLIGWPIREQAASSVHSESAWTEEDSPSKSINTARVLFTEASPVRRIQRLQSPVSPSPIGTMLSLPPPTASPSDKSLVRDPVVVYEDEQAADFDDSGAGKLDTQSTQALSQLSSGILGASQSDASKGTDDFSDQDEENDPIIQSFGSQGDNLLPRMASIKATDSPKPGKARLIPEKSVSPPRRSSSESTNEADASPLANHIINQLAFSRLSSTPLSTIMQNLPAELKGDPVTCAENKSLAFEELRSILDSTVCIGKVSREGKDAAGKALESEYYYLPDQDVDEGRRATVVEGLRKPGLRACRKQHKQYYWRKPKKA
ncbi:MAG: hypothetical protein M1837_000630 [Sclerophora amabilis]|nr:MAG: hypothetical protein M1837_000630 [Sclerophora amabilis]